MQYKSDALGRQKLPKNYLTIVEFSSVAKKKEIKTMKAIFLLVVASCVTCQQLPLNYSGRSVAGVRAGICPDTQDLREAIEQDIR